MTASETLASGTALALRGMSPESLTEGQLDEVALLLGAWLGGMISILDPDIIVIGGGLSQIGEPLFSRLRTITPTRTINQFADQTPIVPAQLASNVGVLGAACAALDQLTFHDRT